MRRLSCARTRFSFTSCASASASRDRFFGDLVEDDAADRHLRLEHLAQVPADRLAFAVRVGREHQLGGVLHGGLERCDVFPLVGGDDVVGREVAVGVDAQAAPRLAFDFVGHFGGRFRQIADVPVAGLDSVSAPRNRPSVRAFAGDSTMTSGFAIEAAPQNAYVSTRFRIGTKRPPPSAGNQTRAVPGRASRAHTAASGLPWPTTISSVE